MRKIIEIPVGDLMSAPALTVKPETIIDELRIRIDALENAQP